MSHKIHRNRLFLRPFRRNKLLKFQQRLILLPLVHFHNHRILLLDHRIPSPQPHQDGFL